MEWTTATVIINWVVYFRRLLFVDWFFYYFLINFEASILSSVESFFNLLSIQILRIFQVDFDARDILMARPTSVMQVAALNEYATENGVLSVDNDGRYVGYWVGYTDLINGTQTAYKDYRTGIEMSLFLWGIAEPSKESEHCVASLTKLYGLGDAGLADLPCHWKRYAVCETLANPTNSSDTQ